MNKYLISFLSMFLFIIGIGFGNNIENNVSKDFINERNKQTLTKNNYDYIYSFLKRRFYNNNSVLKKIHSDFSKINNIDKIHKYILLSICYTESGCTNYGGYGSKLKEYYNISYCSTDPNDTNPMSIYNRNEDWLYNRYEGVRNWRGHQIAVCKLYQKLSNKEREKFINWKTSYAGAIGVFQMMPINLTHMLKTEKINYNKGDLNNISFYLNSIDKFISLKDLNWNKLNYQQLKKCNNAWFSANRTENGYNFYSEVGGECKKLKSKLFFYNKSYTYIKKVLNNAIDLYRMNESGIYGSPVNDMKIYKNYGNNIKKDNKVININNPSLRITQGYKLKSRAINNGWHPALDIVIKNNIFNKNAGVEVNNNNTDKEVIYNLNEPGYCYFMYKEDNPNHNMLNKRSGNTIICTSKDGKTKLLYAHLKKFNHKLFKNSLEFNKENSNIVNGWLNLFLNNNYTEKFKKRVNLRKVKVEGGEIIGYIGNSGGTTGQHLHYSILFNNKPLPQTFLKNIVMYIRDFK